MKALCCNLDCFRIISIFTATARDSLGLSVVSYTIDDNKKDGGLSILP